MKRIFTLMSIGTGCGYTTGSRHWLTQPARAMGSRHVTIRVCLETGMVITRTAETGAAFLRQLRAAHPEPLIVIWDHVPAHGGDAIRAYLSTPDLHLQLIRLPAYSPDDNADEHSWQRVRAEVTANTCFGTAATVREHIDAFFRDLGARAADVRQRCRTNLPSETEAFVATPM